MGKISGIYMIWSRCKPWRFYIGSSIDIKRRLYHHKETVHDGTHHAIKLRRHVSEYGENDLFYCIIEQINSASPKELLEREQSYLSLLKPYFNSTLSAGDLRGYKQSEETKEKRRRSMKGKKRGPQTAEHKRNRYESWLRGGKGNGLLGKPKPQRVRDKISATLMGRKPPPKSAETREKLRKANFGKKRSEESKRKQSLNCRGRIPWNKGLSIKTNEKLRLSHEKRMDTIKKKGNN